LKRAFITVILLLGSLFASSAIAAYSEVWNPPEAQAVKGKTKPRAATPATAKKKRKNTTAVKQIADKAQVDPSAASRAKAAQSPSASPRPSEPVIPRKIEPNGQVMRV
jgi:hypothetical protein